MSKSLLAALLVVSASPLLAADLPATFATSTTLTAAGGPYTLVSDVSIPVGVTVTVKPGVQLIASGDYRLFVNGTLKGAGTQASPVVIRAADANARGAWQGVYVNRSGRVELTQAKLLNAVTNLACPGGTVILKSCSLKLAQEDGLQAWNEATVRLTDCKLNNNHRRGLTLEGWQAQGEISGCEFRGNGGYPVRLKATLVELLKSGNTYPANGTSRIAVSCSLSDDIADDDTWTAQPVAFDLGAEESAQVLRLTASGHLTLPAGARLFADGFDCRGELTALGTADKPCRFSPGEPHWAGLNLSAGSSATLAHCLITGAATGLTADGATLTLSDSTVSDCQYDGLRLTGNTRLLLARNLIAHNGRNGLRLEGPTLTGSVGACKLRYNGSYPVWALAGNVALLGTGNSYLGNTPQRIGISCGGSADLTSGTHSWVRQGIPFDLTVNPSGTVLNLAAAATLNLPAPLTLFSGGMVVRGTLNVGGQSGKPVTFLPAPDVKRRGAWAGLQFEGGKGQLLYANIDYATTGVSLHNSSVRVEGCRLRYSQLDGLACTGTSAPVVVGTALVSNSRHGLYFADTARPNLGDLSNASVADDGGNTLRGNGGYDLYNDSPNAIRAQNNTWSSSDLSVIAQRVYDHADNPAKGTVIYAPPQAAPAQASVPVAVGGLSAFPAGAGGVEICWRQTAGAVVEARLFNLSGRCLALPVPARSVAAGTARVYWPGRDAKGKRLPPGLYLLRLEAFESPGNRHNTATTVRLP